MSCISVSAHCLWPCHWAPLKIAWLPLLYNFPSDNYTHSWDPSYQTQNLVQIAVICLWGAVVQLQCLLSPPGMLAAPHDSGHRKWSKRILWPSLSQSILSFCSHLHPYVFRLFSAFIIAIKQYLVLILHFFFFLIEAKIFMQFCDTNNWFNCVVTKFRKITICHLNSMYTENALLQYTVQYGGRD